MLLRIIVVLVGIMSGCQFLEPHTHAPVSVEPVGHPIPEPVTSVRDTGMAPETIMYNYRVLDPEATGLEHVYDDGKQTYVLFKNPGPPPGLMLFDEQGRALGFHHIGQRVVIPGLYQGVLVRTPNHISYAQPMAPHPARVIAEREAPVMVPQASSTVASVHGLSRNLQGLVTVDTELAGVPARMVRVPFRSGSAALTLPQDVRRALVAAGQAADRVQIRGRTDATGDPEKNSLLARARALNTRMILMVGGVDASKLHAVSSVGRYIAPNDTPADRALNRRVEVVFVGNAGARILVAQPAGLTSDPRQGSREVSQDRSALPTLVIRCHERVGRVDLRTAPGDPLHLVVNFDDGRHQEVPAQDCQIRQLQFHDSRPER